MTKNNLGALLNSLWVSLEVRLESQLSFTVTMFGKKFLNSIAASDTVRISGLNEV